MGFLEFVLIVASIIALNPLALDLMLPAQPDMAAAFGITNPNRMQAVLSIFLLGFGVGQILVGPLSDRFGRRRTVLAGLVEEHYGKQSDDATVQAFLELVDRRRKKLQRRAMKLGDHLYAKKPKALARRMKKSWHSRAAEMSVA